jgi:hypothetical protein
VSAAPQPKPLLEQPLKFAGQVRRSGKHGSNFGRAVADSEKVDRNSYSEAPVHINCREMPPSSGCDSGVPWTGDGGRRSPRKGRRIAEAWVPSCRPRPEAPTTGPPTALRCAAEVPAGCPASPCSHSRSRLPLWGWFSPPHPRRHAGRSIVGDPGFELRHFTWARPSCRRSCLPAGCGRIDEPKSLQGFFSGVRRCAKHLSAPPLLAEAGGIGEGWSSLNVLYEK